MLTKEGCGLSVILSWLLTVIIIIGNGLVIYLITTRRKLRTKTNWFVLSLAVADFGVGAIYFPSTFTCRIRDMCVSRHVRVIVYAILSFLIYASVMNICALALDRYLAIVKPMRYVTFLNTKRVALLVSAAWGVAFLVVLFRCLIDWFFTTSGKTRDIIKNCFFGFVVILKFSVCIFLLFATTRIFLVARRHARQNAALIAQLKFNHRIQHGRVFKPQEAAATKMVGVVVSVFLSCYLLDMYDTVCKLTESYTQNETLDMVFVLLTLLNSAVNPVAYALFKREIRKELKRLFCC